MRAETVNEFIARGGKITVAKPGPKKFDRSGIYKKDKQLKALRALANQVDDERILTKIENAINIRIEILKVTF